MSFDRPFCFIHKSGCMTCGMESLCCRCREEMQGDEF